MRWSCPTTAGSRTSASTATEIFGGYILAVVVGIGIALLFSWFRRLEMVAMPLLVSLNMIPKVALGPLIIVWFSYGIGPNIMIAFAICFFPIVLTTARGLREVEPDLLDLVRTLRGSRWQIFTKIQLPGALPYIFSGMKVAAILAVAGAMVGEFLGSDRGLGYLMLQVQVTLDTAAMFMAVILITLIGMAALRPGARPRAGCWSCATRASSSGAMSEPFIRLAGVRKVYRTRGAEFLAISEASFDVEAGELISLVGPSGCGKTTLLKILAGLHAHDSGEVRIGSADPAVRSRPRHRHGVPAAAAAEVAPGDRQCAAPGRDPRAADGREPRSRPRPAGAGRARRLGGQVPL